MGGNPDLPLPRRGSPLPLLPPQALELPSQGDASPQPRVGENDQSPPLPEAVGEHGHPLHEALSTRQGEDGFAYVTQLSLTENKKKEFHVCGKTCTNCTLSLLPL